MSTEAKSVASQEGKQGETREGRQREEGRQSGREGIVIFASTDRRLSYREKDRDQVRGTG